MLREVVLLLRHPKVLERLKGRFGGNGDAVINRARYSPWIARKDQMEGSQRRSDFLALDKQAKGPLKNTIYANHQNVMPQSKEADHFMPFQVSVLLRFAQG